jgi:hypothetical protein
MKTGRNDPCPCGSGKKYKHCCYAEDSVKHEEAVIEAASNDEEISDDEHAGDAHEHHKHPKDRARFQGEVRGGSASFKPRSTRRAQRGT